MLSVRQRKPPRTRSNTGHVHTSANMGCLTSCVRPCSPIQHMRKYIFKSVLQFQTPPSYQKVLGAMYEYISKWIMGAIAIAAVLRKLTRLFVSGPQSCCGEKAGKAD